MSDEVEVCPVMSDGNPNVQFVFCHNGYPSMNPREPCQHKCRAWVPPTNYCGKAHSCPEVDCGPCGSRCKEAEWVVGRPGYCKIIDKDQGDKP